MAGGTTVISVALFATWATSATGSTPDADKAAAVAAGSAARALSPQETAALLDTADKITFNPSMGVVSGPPSDVAAIQAQMPTRINTYLNLQDLPQDPQLRQGAAKDGAIAAAKSTMPDLFAPAVLSQETADIVAGIVDRASTPAMEMMQKATLGTPVWNSVTVEGDNAVAIFTSDVTHLSSVSGLVDEGRDQFQLQVQRGADGQWRILREGVVLMDGQN